VIGKTLGHYKILRALDGGAGDRYAAEDTARGRSVALTVLHSDAAGTPEMLRERARAVAGLSHPNLTAIEDFGEDGGLAYLVTELPEGESLRDRLQDRRLSPVEAVEYARQIAEGVAAAHARDVVHLDLHPENVLVSKAGKVKVLGFHLGETTAKGAASEGYRLRYRSPEQVEGRSGDARSDVFSFGAILYEMLSGESAFGRNSDSQTIAAIRDEDPPDLSTKVSLPPSLVQIVTRCLAKLPEERFGSMREVVAAIDELSEEKTAERAPMVDEDRPKRKWKFFTFLA